LLQALVKFAALSQGCGQDISGLQAAPWDKNPLLKDWVMKVSFW
jgi:hypothetical protein